MPEPIISIKNARKSFQSITGDRLLVLDGIDFDVYSGEFLVILGPSGCGKSTFLNILARQDILDSGTIHCREENSSNNHSRIAVVWQEESLMPWKTALGNVEFPLIVRGIAHNERRYEATKWLQAVGLEGFENYYPSQLSQGMRRRVALASALVTHPNVLLMDEPFAALDVYTKQQLEKEIVKLWEKIDATVIMVTHDVEEAVALSDRILVLTERPARVKMIRTNSLPRPRDLDVLYSDVPFHEIVRELWANLTTRA